MAKRTPADAGSALEAVRRRARRCRRCPLYKRATQTVFGVGPTSATLMLVGEQPGDVEDRTGHERLFPSPLAAIVAVTVHPSSILRARDTASRARARREFVRDRQAIARRIAADPG